VMPSSVTEKRDSLVSRCQQLSLQVTCKIPGRKLSCQIRK